MRSVLLMTYLVGSLISLNALAAKQAAYCHLLDKEGAVVEGVNTKKLYPIASVSKLFTAYWAVTKLGAHYRYKTTFHILPVADNVADLHIQGSNAPYFAREQLQYVIGELNRLGIKKVRTLTFDEKFRFLNLVRGDAFAAGHYSPSFPNESRVKVEIEEFFDNVSAKYSSTRTKGRNRSITMPEKISLTVENIEYLSAKDFFVSPAAQSANVRHLISQSVPLHRLLKEMNRNSNNYAANLIFEDLGGAARFNAFIQQQLGVKSDQVKFYNGSGDNHDFDGVTGLYNSATCEVVLSTIASLKKSMEMQELNLQNVIAVAGADSTDENSTVSDLYENDTTEKSLLAKTGTVDPAITLAGLANTEQGEVYFGYIYSTSGSRADWRSARKKIGSAVLGMFAKFGGSKSIDYNYQSFLPFDDKSALYEKTDAKPVMPLEPSEQDLKHEMSELFRATAPRPLPPLQPLPWGNVQPVQGQWQLAMNKYAKPQPTSMKTVIPYRPMPEYELGGKK